MEFSLGSPPLLPEAVSTRTEGEFHHPSGSAQLAARPPLHRTGVPTSRRAVVPGAKPDSYTWRPPEPFSHRPAWMPHSGRDPPEEQTPGGSCGGRDQPQLPPPSS